MMRREFVKRVSGALGLGVVGSAAGKAAPSSKPNVILCMCDDLGWGDVGFNGAPICQTPELDEMARHSLLFSRFYAAAPVCSPTRGSAITGRHPYRYGITFANVGHMKREEVTLAEVLQKQGYATGHFGKWHLGTLTTKVKDANRGMPGATAHYAPPSRHGFDVFFSTESKVPTWDPMRVPKRFGAGQSRHYGWLPVANEAAAEAYGTRYWDGEEHAVTGGLEGDDSRLIMDRALPFIRNAVSGGKPFLAVIWFHTPHLPVVAGEAYRRRYADCSLKKQLYYGCISAMDQQVGRLRHALRQLGVAENTMLWFASDNGPENNTPGSPGPFRGRKRSLYEGGVRVPGLLEWPARIPKAAKTDVPAVTCDYFPTVLDVLGYRLPEAAARPYDGISLLPLIAGRMNRRPRPIGFQSGHMATLSDNQYKLVLTGNGKTTGGDSDGRAELYDLLADPAEKQDLAARHPELVEKMRAVLREWQLSCANSAKGEDYH